MVDPPPRTEQLDGPTAAWLIADGRQLVADAAARLAAGESLLRVGTDLRGQGLDPVRAAAVTDAAAARRAVDAGRSPVPDEWLLTRAGLEQLSDPAVAAWRARRFSGAGVAVDLCAGLGGDAWALAGHAATVIGVERHAARVRLLAHNVRSRAAVVRADALAPPVRPGSLLHADPDRRTPRGRARWLDDHEPPVGRLRRAAARCRARGIGITVSPALAWHDRALPEEAEIEFLQVDRDLTEAVLWLGALRREARRATATLLPEGRTRSRSGPVERVAVRAPGAVLVEPAAALVRARLHDELAREQGLWRIAERRALLSGERVPPSPWWRRWRVEAVLAARPRPVRRWLRDADELPVSVAVHGLQASPEAWLAALGSPPRGPRGRRLHLVRTDDGAVTIVTRSWDG